MVASGTRTTANGTASRLAAAADTTRLTGAPVLAVEVGSWRCPGAGLFIADAARSGIP